MWFCFVLSFSFVGLSLSTTTPYFAPKMSGKGTVLVLGAGLVTRPLVHYLAKHGFHVVLASRTLENAQKLIDGAANTEAHQYDITKDDETKLDAWTQQSVAVISMLPYIYHAQAAKIAIKHKKHFLTTSYVSDAMRALEADAKAAGIVLLNECGVDPGSDHMSAQKIIDDAHAHGGQVISFTSYCGGLPAPADNDNPLGYKFSWAPRGVLLAAKNDATFLRDGATVTIPAGALYDNVESFEVPGVGTFDGYGNRNSNNYISVYNIPETKTIIRGTFRYDGWCKTLRKLLDLGYLNIEPLNGGALVGKTYAEFTAALLGKNDTATLKADIAAKLGLSVDDKLIQNFEWLGLLGADTIKDAAPIDALVTAMLPRMQYTENQRDMIFMQHKLRVEYSAEKKAKTIFSRLVCYGNDDGSAMSRTVSYPVAIATRLLLEGKVKLNAGLVIPTLPELYNPILEELAELGIKFEETETEESLQ